MPAPPPAVAEAARAALAIAQRDEWRRAHLRALVRRFRTGAQQLGLTLMASDTPIQPIIIGTAAQALRYSDVLAAAGILIGAIRPPTVPQGTARLRVTFSAAHSEAQVERLLGALETLCTAQGAAST
jgi:8-amino-7-oxononanoate synthase